MNTLKKMLLFSLLLVMTACSQKPAQIHYGNDECVHCKMMIYDNRFASQIVTETGKALKFDAIECMVAYTSEHKSELENAHFWVSDFNNPGSWIEVQNANIIKSDVINSPMGASLLAIENEDSTRQHLDKYPGKIVDWETLVY